MNYPTRQVNIQGVTIETTCPEQMVLYGDPGLEDYVTAMSSMVQKADLIRKPGNPPPDVVVNRMVQEAADYFGAMLPNVTLRELASFFGAAMGVQLAPHVVGGMPVDEVCQNASTTFFVACWESLVRAAPELQRRMEAAQHDDQGPRLVK